MSVYVYRHYYYYCLYNYSFISLSLSPPAAPVITTPPMNTTVLAPEQAVFMCIVEGFPLLTVSWVTISNDNDAEITLTPSDNIDIIENRSMSTLTSTLTLLLTSPRQSGRYMCVTSNVLGEDNATALLTVNGELHRWYHSCFATNS